MEIKFYKYQGAGNDFVMIDNRKNTFKKDTKTIKKMCHRNFGIGADGLILLEEDNVHDFKMIYYNADGQESTMCGNGGRCIVGFAHQLGLFEKKTVFNAVDGIHHASLENGIVSLQMIDVDELKVNEDYSFLNTGSPHHVQLVSDIDNFDVHNIGREIRNEIYGVEGSNVNFVEKINDNSFKIRTYERGVEGETLACGTGATAVAIAMFHAGQTDSNSIIIETKGGQLSVSFDTKSPSASGRGYRNVFLTGAYQFVFSGVMKI